MSNHKDDYLLAGLMVFFLIVFLPFFIGNAGGDDDSETIRDMAGRQVEIKVKSENSSRPIIALHAVPDLIVDRLAHNRHKTAQKNFVKSSSIFMNTNDYDRVNALPLVNAFYEPSSTEEIVSLHPAFIVTLTKDPKLESRKKELGAPVIALSKDTLKDLALDWKVMGRTIKYAGPTSDRIFTYLMNQVELFDSKTSSIDTKKRVWLANKDENTIPGPQTIMQDAMKHAGADTYWDLINYPEGFDPTEETVKVPIESMIDYDPEVIFCSDAATKDKLMGDERLKNVSAIKSGKVYAEKKAFRIDSMSAFAGTAWMMNKIYPDLLGITDGDYGRDFYKNLFNSNVTEDELNLEN